MFCTTRVYDCMCVSVPRQLSIIYFLVVSKQLNYFFFQVKSFIISHSILLFFYLSYIILSTTIPCPKKYHNYLRIEKALKCLFNRHVEIIVQHKLSNMDLKIKMDFIYQIQTNSYEHNKIYYQYILAYQPSITLYKCHVKQYFIQIVEVVVVLIMSIILI